MNLNYSKIFFITFISVVIGLIYNHFNHNGLDFIRDERILNWESDSLESFNKLNSPTNNIGMVDPQKNFDSVLIRNTDIKVEPFSGPKAISINLAYKLFKQGIQFIDARALDEFSEGHIKGAINFPFYRSENYLSSINELNKNEFIVTYCESAECDIAISDNKFVFI